MFLLQNKTNRRTITKKAWGGNKEHKNVKRDCDAMFLELNLDALSFERIYFDAMNRQQTEYILTHELVQTLITGYSIKLRHAVIQRLNQLDLPNQIPQDQRAFELSSVAIKAAEAFGLIGNQAKLSADRAIKKMTGYSPLKLLDIELVKEVQCLNLTPTEIGKQLGLSAIKTNLLLAFHGYQSADRPYTPTELARYR